MNNRLSFLANLVLIISLTSCSQGVSHKNSSAYEAFNSRKSIIWQNYDGEVLQRAYFSSGKEPEYTGPAPTREKEPQYSYVFDKWVLSDSSDENTIIYIATYNSFLNYYTITWQNYDGTILEVDSDIPYGETPSYDSQTPKREKDDKYTYSFKEWQPSVRLVDSDCIYIAQYTNSLNYYRFTLDPNGGQIGQTEFTIGYDETIDLVAPSLRGYIFEGWYDGANKIDNHLIWKYGVDKTFVAHWKIENYSITYNLNNGTNNSSNPSSYTINDSISFAEPTRNGYAFLGWFDQSGNKVSLIESGTVGNLVLNARWSAKKNELLVTSDDLTKGTVEITNGSGYSDETITVVASPIDDCVFKGWYHESKKVSDEATYTFTMPLHDYSLEARFFTKAEEDAMNVALGIMPDVDTENMKITYGLYPQKRVSDSSLLSNLNAITKPESNGWYLYNNEYYAKCVASTHYNYGTGYSFDDGTKIVDRTTYWFKCEPIIWNILSNSEGDYFLLSSVLLDAHCFHTSSSSRYVDGKRAYANNYKYSDLRQWLTNDFYNSAFALDDSLVQTTLVDNSASTTSSSSNSYACENTEDKVFLPSYKDYSNSSYGFPTNAGSSKARYSKTTDWARARGADCSSDYSYKGNGGYWTRSPYPSEDDVVSGISYDGNITGYYIDMIRVEILGVRPAIIIRF